jgi:RHS repeat-associated protein
MSTIGYAWEYFAYDGNSNLIAHQDARGKTTAYGYDAMNRRVAASYPNDGDTYFAYDEAGNLAGAQDARGWNYFEYDPVNRLTAEQDPFGVITRHEYDAVGRRIAAGALSSAAYYAYDAAGRMEHAEAGREEVGTTYYDYDPCDRVVRKLLGNGSYAYYAYDAAGRLTGIRNCFPDGAPLAYFDYGYDKASRVTRIDREDGRHIYYTYDGANRLTSEIWMDPGSGESEIMEWSYDEVNNRLWQYHTVCPYSRQEHSYYVYDQANQLESIDVVLEGSPVHVPTYFQYDIRGNCTAVEESTGTTYFEYNDANLVTRIQYKDDTVNYFWYDARQRRYAIEESSGVTYLIWDENGMNLLAERDVEGNVVAEYTHGYTPTGGIGSMVGARKVESGATYYQYPGYDHKGTVAVLVDETGTLRLRYDLNAWALNLDTDTHAPTASNRFLYQSNWILLKDSGGRFYITPTRIYDAWTGRFLQRDRLGKSGTNAYSYANGIPVSLTDASGAAIDSSTWFFVFQILVGGSMIVVGLLLGPTGFVPIALWTAGIFLIAGALYERYVLSKGKALKNLKNESWLRFVKQQLDTHLVKGGNRWQNEAKSGKLRLDPDTYIPRRGSPEASRELEQMYGSIDERLPTDAEVKGQIEWYAYYRKEAHTSIIRFELVMEIPYTIKYTNGAVGEAGRLYVVESGEWHEYCGGVKY